VPKTYVYMVRKMLRRANDRILYMAGQHKLAAERALLRSPRYCWKSLHVHEFYQPCS